MLSFRAKLPIVPFARSALSLEPYQWQQETLCHVAEGHPTALVACNGAGKTSTILTSAALWCLYNWPLARIVVTSSSWEQIKKQFFASAHLFRLLALFRGWDFLETEIRSGQGGFISGISVDDPGRAEGFHQRQQSPVMILADECKTIDDSTNRQPKGGCWVSSRNASADAYATEFNPAARSSRPSERQRL
jgi:hypothetical protein